MALACKPKADLANPQQLLSSVQQLIGVAYSALCAQQTHGSLDQVQQVTGPQQPHAADTAEGAATQPVPQKLQAPSSHVQGTKWTLQPHYAGWHRQQAHDITGSRVAALPLPLMRDTGSSSSTGSSSTGSSSSSTSSSNPHSTQGSSSKSSALQARSDALSQALVELQMSRGGQLKPSDIVKQLDKYIIGQADAKRAVAVALRNRWRRHKLQDDLAEEITPKNILMIGPTGCGKTEIARRLAMLVDAPFIKVEATKFTELGFVGRDVDEIVKDLMEASISLARSRLADAIRPVAEAAAEHVILSTLVGNDEEAAIASFRDLYRRGDLDATTVTLDASVLSQGGGGGGGMGSNPSHMMQALAAAWMEATSGRGGQRGGQQGGKTTLTVAEARKLLTDGEVERALSSSRVIEEALRSAQQDGIVFIDEIDKIVETSRGAGSATSRNVSSEGVQRDLLPILEGSVVPTKHGNVSTDHVLFICSGAFHSSKPADMLAELQGRLPVRVELAGLTADDFYRILTEPTHSILKQQQVLLATEGVDLVFTDAAIRAIAESAHEANRLLDNIGARRLYTVVERVLADISFSAPEKVAEAQQQQQQQKQQEAATSSSSSSKGSKARAAGSNSKASSSGKASSSSKASKPRASNVTQEASSSSSSGTSSSSREAPAQPERSSSGSSGIWLRYEVTEEMVHACMKDVLKQKDLSRYML